MSDPVRLGYVGCGFMAQHVHLPNFASIQGCRLSALAELRPRLGKLVAARFEVPKVYRSHLELAADDTIDAVAVSAAFDLQGEIAADLLRAGKHVFVEKPMAVSIRQAQRILESSTAGARLMVGYMKRYDPGNELARETVRLWRESGEMGRPVLVRNHGFGGNWLLGLDHGEIVVTDEQTESRPRYEHLPDWLPDSWAERYVLYLQQYTHNFNLLRFLLDVGDDARVGSVDLDEDGRTGIVTLVLGGVRAVIESAETEHHGWDEHTHVYFDRGWVRVHAPPFFVRPSQAAVEVYEAAGRPGFRYPIATPAWPYLEEARAFVDGLHTGAPFRSTGEDTLTDVRLCEDVYREMFEMSGGTE